MKKVCFTLLLVLCTALNLMAQTARINTGEENTNWKPQYTIDFVAAFDPDGRDYALEREKTLEDFGEKVVSRMNIVMRNSNINGKFKLKGTYVMGTNITDVERWPSEVLNDKGLTDYVKGVEGDICLVFAPVYSSEKPATGNAIFRADAGKGYGCVKIQDAYVGWTAIHEAGHIMGCHHALAMDNNPDRGDTCTYNYGAERRAADGSYYYSTIMGYYGELLPYFSSPDLYHNGVQMGSAQENNVLVLNTRMPIIARLGDRRTAIELSISEWAPNAQKQQTSVSFVTIPSRGYRISSDASWLSTSETQGYAGQDFTISVAANTTGSPRTGHITVTDWEEGSGYDDVLAAAVITVTQSAGSGGTVTPGDKVYVNSVSVAPREISIPVGSTYQLTSTVLPANATNPTLRWWTGNDLVATVSSTGLVTAKNEGEVFIYADTTDGSNLGDYTYVTVTKAGTTPVDPGTGGGGDNTDPDVTPDGKIYTIRLANTSPALYLTTTLVSEKGDNKTFGLSATPERFCLASSEKGGFTIQSIDTKAHVGVNSSVAWDCADVATLWTIAHIDGTETTILQAADTSKGLGCDDAEAGQGIYTDKNSSKSKFYTWYIEEQKAPEPEQKKCAAPVISLADGELSISCATDGAVVSCTVTAAEVTIDGTGTIDLRQLAAKQQYVLTAKAKADGYLDSEAASLSFSLADIASLLAEPGDMNTDGQCTIADITLLVKKVLGSQP